MTKALVAHPGTQYSSSLAQELHRRGRLSAFHTGLAIRAGSTADRGCQLLPLRLRTGLANRRLKEIPRNKLQLYPLNEILSLARFRGGRATVEDVLHRRNEVFQKCIPRASIEAAEVVVGFDTSSWLLAERCQEIGRPFILDQSIGHPAAKERAFQNLRRLYPAWTLTAPRKADDHVAEERSEHQLARMIVAPSRFVRDTLVEEGVAAEKIRIIPFGTDLTMFHPGPLTQSSHPQVFLFVGSLSVRKGLPVLLDAWRQLTPEKAELWLVGSGSLPETERDSLPPSVRLLGPRSRAEVAAIMRSADVFVFPSFFEGLAQVQIEALASGLPLIGTRESGAQELIEEGINGFLVPAGDVAATADRMRRLAQDHQLLATMRAAAISRRERLSWSVYGDRWCSVLSELEPC